MTGPVTAAELEGLLEDLVPIGRDGDGATTRLAWTAEDERASVWFERRAAALGRRSERDAADNLWAAPATPPPWWAVGSHLDTVVRGGRFDGALGVAAGFAVAARAPVAVVSFADEEGARFNTPTFGSRALTGRLDVDDALRRADASGTTLADAMTAAGIAADGLREAPAWLDRLRGLVELHIDQSRALDAAGVPAAAVRSLAARLRLQVVVKGRADHAGTTPRDERRDALAAAARLIVRADDLAAERADMVFTATRIEVEPNAATTVPATVRLWLDARAPEPQAVAAWRAAFESDAAAIAARTRTALDVTTAAWSPGTRFPAEVRDAITAGVAAAAGAAVAPVVCFAGHDAGIVADERPAGMVLVRNPSGISHAPEEDVSLADAAVAANALVAALGRLA
ncbi:MAG TPA: hydantoinase/carbamoylase family amidase [Solirubrobacteraceae bacterium]